MGSHLDKYCLFLLLSLSTEHYQPCLNDFRKPRAVESHLSPVSFVFTLHFNAAFDRASHSGLNHKTDIYVMIVMYYYYYYYSHYYRPVESARHPISPINKIRPLNTNQFKERRERENSRRQWGSEQLQPIKKHGPALKFLQSHTIKCIPWVAAPAARWSGILKSHVRGWLSTASLVICSPHCSVQYVELRGYCLV